jgi:hypothetical protein
MTGGFSPRRALGPVVGTSAGTVHIVGVGVGVGRSDLGVEVPIGNGTTAVLDGTRSTGTAGDAVQAARLATIARLAGNRTAAMLRRLRAFAKGVPQICG